MAEYTTINDDEIDTRSPITSALLVSLRDNMLGVIEGSTFAPNIQAVALDDSAGIEAVSAVKIINNTITGAKIPASQIGIANINPAMLTDMIRSGDSHKHTRVYDGFAVDGDTLYVYSAFSAGTLGNSKLNHTISASNSWTIASGATVTVPKGIYNITLQAFGSISGVDIWLQIRIGSLWYGIEYPSGAVFSDGVRARLYNGDSVNRVVVYQQFS